MAVVELVEKGEKKIEETKKVEEAKKETSKTAAS
jgi:hypothetical protein